MANPALSPDGHRVAVVSSESGDRDIWIHDLVRSTKTRLTFDEVCERSPTWSPSGEEIAYAHQSQLAGAGSIRGKAADGSGEAAVLGESESSLWDPAWSRDGRYLVYREINPETQRDILYLEFGTDGDVSEPVKFLNTPADERAPRLSPDGRFVAYTSNESGREEIYVRPFPEGNGKWQASVNGGTQPLWAQ